MAMGMGVSTSSSKSGPFKPPFFSSPATTRRLTRTTLAATTWMSSSSSPCPLAPKRFLARRGHILQSTNGPTSSATGCSISNKFHRNSIRTYFTEEMCPKFDRTRHFYPSEEDRRQYVSMNYSNHSTSSTQIKPRVPTPFSKENILSVPRTPKDMEHMWFEESKKIQQAKENSKKIVPHVTENSSGELVRSVNNDLENKKFELRETEKMGGAEDGSDYTNKGLFDLSLNMKNSNGNGQSLQLLQSQLQSSSSGETSILKGGGRRVLPHGSIEAYHGSEVKSYKNFVPSPMHELNESKGKSLSQIELFSKREFSNETQINGSSIDVLKMEEHIFSNKTVTKAQKPKPKPIDQRENLCRIYDEVLLVDNISTAREVVGLLTTEYRDLVHACDTEVAKIDVKKETAVDHGEVICFSIYSGPDVNFGNGKKCIWVDVLDGSGKELLMEFAPFFEDPYIKKVWHNYSFDSHVIENYGIKLSGFYADTMHMARLWDSSRRTEGGYSLEALTSDSRVMNGVKSSINNDLIGKISMKTIFGKKKVKKDGHEGKITNIAPVEELQRGEKKLWVCYSALDSMSTLQLFQSLQCKLKEMDWFLNGEHKGNMYQFYEEYWRPFGELLVKMETEGMLVDRAFLAEIEKVAVREQQVAADRFRKWAASYCPDAMHMNVGSDAQLRQLFFGNIQNSKDQNVFLPETRTFKVPNVDKVIEEGKKVPRKFRDITLSKIGEAVQTELYTASGWPSVSGDALKIMAGKVSSEYDWSDPLISNDIDDSSDQDLDISSYGTAYNAFGGNTKGKEACHAIAALCEVCSIDSLISNFILPLQSDHISGKNKRIHCSLNINTETGRLSARRPNLQNQPALEKDRYKIRQAFVAAPGNSLVVADYGQLELRILAHLANCQSMKDAFRAGGDFHSRTAMNMYSHIREAVEQKQVLLEWHPQPGEDKPPVPLLKDAFASERRKAKMLNFSIAYGKTPVGLARDWKVSVKEAKATVNLWYKDRKEVLKWQKERKEQANKHRCVQTLLGRTRNFPSMSGASNAHRGHIERAAINTPVQGSAADVAMCAMLEISKNVRLKQLGWKLLLQVHDEVILEGPTESAQMAKDIVVECMSKPFGGTNILDVDLAVDAKCAQNWYAAK